MRRKRTEEPKGHQVPWVPGRKTMETPPLNVKRICILFVSQKLRIKPVIDNRKKTLVSIHHVVPGIGYEIDTYASQQIFLHVEAKLFAVQIMTGEKLVDCV